MAEKKEILRENKAGAKQRNYMEEIGNFSHRYNRLALAEAVIERGAENLCIIPYPEFKERYESSISTLKISLSSAKHFVKSLEKGEDIESVMRELKGGADLMYVVTGVENPRINIASESGSHQY